MYEKYFDLFEKIRNTGETLEFYGQQTFVSISQLEKVLDIRFPKSFINFLLELGGGGSIGSGISGIYNNNALKMNDGTVYGDTLTSRSEQSLPNHLIVIFKNDSETIWCLDMLQTNALGENAIVSFDVFSKSVTKIANTFDEFFHEYLRIRAG